ncbi:MAG: type VI secretion system baseplate subunit TssG [Paracoccaceae bacterium]
MTGPRRNALRDNPRAFGFLALLRDFERRHPDRPRIGKNQTLAQEVLRLGQEPFLNFPEVNVTSFAEAEESRPRAPRLRSNFLGYFGPQGALPLNVTAEVHQWFLKRDEAFVRFADLFTSRFQQLFFRAWSDARRIAQFDHPEDRFQIYLGAFLGLASPAAQGRGKVADVALLPLAGLAMSRVKSPVRLRQMLEQLCGVAIGVEEHVPVWLMFEPSDLTRIGQAGSTLGRDMRLGSRVQSVNEKIRVTVRTESLTEYESFLPGGANFARLSDLIFRYLGHEVEVEVAPSLPAAQVRGMSLGKSGALGWTGWVAPPAGNPGDYRSDAVFSATHGV